MPTFDPRSLHAAVEASLNNSPPAIEEQAAPDAPHKGVSKWAQLATAAGHMADAGSTIYSLNHGAQEANPIYGDNPSAGRVLGTKAGGAAIQMLLQHVIGKHNPGIANAMGLGSGIAMGGVAAHNFDVARKAGK